MIAASLTRRHGRLLALGIVAGLLAAPMARAQPSEPDGVPIPLCTVEQARTDGRCPAVVIAVRRGWIVVEAQRPLYVGERFLIASQRLLRGVDPATQPTVMMPEGEQTGMLVIERVRGNQGAGRLVRNAYAEVGDLVVPTARPFRQALLYGLRFPRTFRIATDLWLGPLLAEDLGFGMLSRTVVEYRFKQPIKLAVELGPGALVHGLEISDRSTGTVQRIDGGTTLAGGIRGVIGLALSIFELSVGLGGAVDTGRTRAAGLQMSIGARVGSLDGINITLDGTFFLPALGRDSEFDTVIGAFNIPVHRRLTLSLQGGGGRPLWAFGTFGFRSYLSGTGGPGTVILSTGIGGGGLTLRRECPPLSTNTLSCVGGEAKGAGPLFQLGLDLRF